MMLHSQKSWVITHIWPQPADSGGRVHFLGAVTVSASLTHRRVESTDQMDGCTQCMPTRAALAAITWEQRRLALRGADANAWTEPTRGGSTFCNANDPTTHATSHLRHLISLCVAARRCHGRVRDQHAARSKIRPLQPPNQGRRDLISRYLGGPGFKGEVQRHRNKKHVRGAVTRRGHKTTSFPAISQRFICCSLHGSLWCEAPRSGPWGPRRCVHTPSTQGKADARVSPRAHTARSP